MFSSHNTLTGASRKLRTHGSKPIRVVGFYGAEEEQGRGDKRARASPKLGLAKERPDLE